MLNTELVTIRDREVHANRYWFSQFFMLHAKVTYDLYVATPLFPKDYLMIKAPVLRCPFV